MIIVIAQVHNNIMYSFTYVFCLTKNRKIENQTFDYQLKRKGKSRKSKIRIEMKNQNRTTPIFYSSWLTWKTLSVDPTKILIRDVRGPIRPTIGIDSTKGPHSYLALPAPCVLFFLSHILCSFISMQVVLSDESFCGNGTSGMKAKILASAVRSRKQSSMRT